MNFSTNESTPPSPPIRFSIQNVTSQKSSLQNPQQTQQINIPSTTLFSNMFERTIGVPCSSCDGHK